MDYETKIKELEDRLSKALPDNYEKWESHEELYEGYERAWERADTVAQDAIKLAKELRDKLNEVVERHTIHRGG